MSSPCINDLHPDDPRRNVIQKIHNVSDRDIPLLYQGLVARGDAPVLTVENYLKWYTLWLVLPNRRAVPVTYAEIEQVVKAADPHRASSPYVNHVPNPAWVSRYCGLKRYRLHARSFEVMVGRWYIEVQDEPAWVNFTGHVVDLESSVDRSAGPRVTFG